MTQVMATKRHAKNGIKHHKIYMERHLHILHWPDYLFITSKVMLTCKTSWKSQMVQPWCTWTVKFQRLRWCHGWQSLHLAWYCEACVVCRPHPFLMASSGGLGCLMKIKTVNGFKNKHSVSARHRTFKNLRYSFNPLSPNMIWIFFKHISDVPVQTDIRIISQSDTLACPAN